jgi:hypothetical protein
MTRVRARARARSAPGDGSRSPSALHDGISPTDNNRRLCVERVSADGGLGTDQDAAHNENISCWSILHIHLACELLTLPNLVHISIDCCKTIHSSVVVVDRLRARSISVVVAPVRCRVRVLIAARKVI